MADIHTYLNNLEPPQLAAYERIKNIVKQRAPEAEETISYGIPTFKYKDKYLIYFGAFKNHMSIFPGAPLKAQKELEGFKLGKGTIQFTVDKPVPEPVIAAIVEQRLKRIDK